MGITSQGPHHRDQKPRLVASDDPETILFGLCHECLTIIGLDRLRRLAMIRTPDMGVLPSSSYCHLAVGRQITPLSDRIQSPGHTCRNVDHCKGSQVNVPRRPRKDVFHCEEVARKHTYHRSTGLFTPGRRGSTRAYRPRRSENRERPATGDAIPVLTGVKGASPGSAPSGFGP